MGRWQPECVQGEDTVKIRVWVGTSHIAGKGLFAAQEIKKGTRIIQYIGAKIRHYRK